MSLINSISPFKELIAYEALWVLPGWTPSKLAKRFRQSRNLPSVVLDELYGSMDQHELLDPIREYVLSKKGYSVAVHGDALYPNVVANTNTPFEVIYYRGNLDLLHTESVSVVGSRQCSPEGRSRARHLTRKLVDCGYTVVSGLAAGIDTEAIKKAISCGGNVIGVIGTPIDQAYPRENEDLHEELAENHLLLSHVPFYRYRRDAFPARRYFFPQRNELMASISKGTIIVEASNTSGTLKQASSCIRHNKILFILDSCFQRRDLTWPERFEKKGAIRVFEMDDIIYTLRDSE